MSSPYTSPVIYSPVTQSDDLPESNIYFSDDEAIDYQQEEDDDDEEYNETSQKDSKIISPKECKTYSSKADSTKDLNQSNFILRALNFRNRISRKKIANDVPSQNSLENKENSTLKNVSEVARQQKQSFALVIIIFLLSIDIQGPYITDILRDFESNGEVIYSLSWDYAFEFINSNVVIGLSAYMSHRSAIGYLSFSRLISMSLYWLTPLTKKGVSLRAWRSNRFAIEFLSFTCFSDRENKQPTSDDQSEEVTKNDTGRESGLVHRYYQSRRSFKVDGGSVAWAGARFLFSWLASLLPLIIDRIAKRSRKSVRRYIERYLDVTIALICALIFLYHFGIWKKSFEGKKAGSLTTEKDAIQNGVTRMTLRQTWKGKFGDFFRKKLQEHEFASAEWQLSFNLYAAMAFFATGFFIATNFMKESIWKDLKLSAQSIVALTGTFEFFSFGVQTLAASWLQSESIYEGFRFLAFFIVTVFMTKTYELLLDEQVENFSQSASMFDNYFIFGRASGVVIGIIIFLGLHRLSLSNISIGSSLSFSSSLLRSCTALLITSLCMLAVNIYIAKKKRTIGKDKKRK